MANALAKLQKQFLEILGSRFCEHIEAVARAEGADLELLFDLILSNEPKLDEALDLAVISFDEAMRRPWVEHGDLVAN